MDKCSSLVKESILPWAYVEKRGQNKKKIITCICTGVEHKHTKKVWHQLQRYILFGKEVSFAKSLWELVEHRHLSALHYTKTLFELRTNLGHSYGMVLQPAGPHFQAACSLVLPNLLYTFTRSRNTFCNENPCNPRFSNTTFTRFYSEVFPT